MNRFLFHFIFRICAGFVFPAMMVSAIGINYGQIADNLPSPEDVVPLVRSIGATKLKLYDADARVLKSFANTGVEFIVCIGNQDLGMMRDAAKALAWVKTNVEAYLPATNITSITVGNEVLTLNDTSLSNNLLPVMISVHAALVSLNLDKKVSVTTAHALSVLETSYPPSAGAFRRDLRGYMTQILDFHVKTGSPFLINAYPYFAYKANPKKIPIDFVLFQPNSGIVDPVSNLHYDNMLFGQIDAVHSALASLGYKKVAVQISETGWPSKGDEDEVGATPENANKYIGNLMKLIAQRKGTPLRPNHDLNVYVFALFNENLKPGPTSERNYGLFKPDGTLAYPLRHTGNNVVHSNSSTSAPAPVPLETNSTSPGYLPASSTPVSFAHFSV